MFRDLLIVVLVLTALVAVGTTDLRVHGYDLNQTWTAKAVQATEPIGDGVFVSLRWFFCWRDSCCGDGHPAECDLP